MQEGDILNILTASLEISIDKGNIGMYVYPQNYS